MILYLSFSYTSTESYPDEIVEKCPFFARLHRIYAARPSINPPAVTTGVGPSGRTIVYHQPTQESNSASQASDASTRTFGDELTNRSSAPPSSLLCARSISSFSVPPETPVASSRPLSQRAMVNESALSAARASIKILPKKRTFEEGILEIQQYVFISSI